MKYLIFAVCFWECVSLATQKLPTITRTVHLYRGEWWVLLAVVLAWLWVGYHLLVEGR